MITVQARFNLTLQTPVSHLFDQCFAGAPYNLTADHGSGHTFVSSTQVALRWRNLCAVSYRASNERMLGCYLSTIAEWGHRCAGDVIYTNMPTQGADAPIPNVQYFWEAFPSGSGKADRTTYLFTYIDADPSRCMQCLALGCASACTAACL